MEIKKKDMKKTGWKRCIEKYYNYKEFEFDGLSGIVSLSYLQKLEAPLTIHYDFGDVMIADNNYKHLQFAFRNENFWLTAMYDNKNNLIELYFDITNGNYFDDLSNPYFYDIFLDIVVTKDRQIHIVDEDELDMALSENVIDLEKYNNAKNTAENLCEYLDKKKDNLITFCNKTLEEMINNSIEINK